LKDHDKNPIEIDIEDAELKARRDFLRSLMKWSSVVIGAVTLGAFAAPTEARAGWINRRGSWLNGAGGGGWINGGGGGWINRRAGGGSWINR